MIALVLSAGFVGFIHSLAPGHWLPVVLLAKARKWPVPTAVFGAMVAASGHILISVVLGVASIFVGSHFLSGYEQRIESYGGVTLIAFGAIYALYSFFRHSHCHGHSHHGPEPAGKGSSGRTAIAFLFSLGFSPCLAVLPVFIASSAKGPVPVFLTMGAFSLGVLAALIGATLTVFHGASKIRTSALDHPLIEHYGDVFAGVGVVIMGIFLLFFPD